MMKLPLSPAAAGLLRALLARVGINHDRILLTDLRSTDWQSLTFVGERHEIELRVPGPDAVTLAEQLTRGLAEAEFCVPGQIVAEIELMRDYFVEADGSIMLHIEALTIVE